MINKRGIEFGFVWIFAILVGAVILGLAVFATSQFIKTERDVGDSFVGKKIGILLNPLETGIESGKTNIIKMIISLLTFISII